jgi:GNAT superfamily N-acetyltransferase
MEVTVRDAIATDIDAIYSLGRSDKNFAVSEQIPFYEKEELQEWVDSPRDNILCVAESESTVVGFFFCKVMSCHWAILDNFYIAKEHRGDGGGWILLGALFTRLRARNIVYLTTLVEHDRTQLHELTKHYGFQQAKSYDWFELFLT